jgi:hypothetical protein
MTCQEPGRPFLATHQHAPQRVLIWDAKTPRETLEAEVQRHAAALGLDRAALSLGTLGDGRAPGQTLRERIRGACRQHQPELAIVLNAEATPGTGFYWDGEDAWGIVGAYGAGRGIGPLGWQRTFVQELGIAFLSHFTEAPGSIFAAERQAFERNADAVTELKPERKSKPGGRQVLSENNGLTRAFVRQQRDGLWVPVE